MTQPSQSNQDPRTIVTTPGTQKIEINPVDQDKELTGILTTFAGLIKHDSEDSRRIAYTGAQTALIAWRQQAVIEELEAAADSLSPFGVRDLILGRIASLKQQLDKGE